MPVLGVSPFVVGTRRRSGQGLEIDGANGHPGPQGQGQFAAVETLQHNSAAPTRIDAMSGDMHHQTQPGQAGATVQPADDIVG